MNKKKILKAGDEINIPVEGSLGILAIGYKGVQAWRKVREKAIAEKKASEEKNQGESK